MRSYNFQLIKGSFTKEEAIHLLTKMADVKIRYHEDKIQSTDSAEDIKMRENRIKDLQKELYEVRRYIEYQSGRVELSGEISI